MDLFGIIQPVYWLSRIFGQSAANVQDDCKSATYKQFDSLMCLIAVSANLCIIGYYMLNASPWGSSMFATSVGTITYPWSVKLSCVVLGSIIVVNFMFRGRFQRLLKMLTHCDSLLAAIATTAAEQLQMNKKRQRKWTALMVVALLGLTLLVGTVAGILAYRFYSGGAKVVYVITFLLYVELADHTFIALVLFYICSCWCRFRLVNVGLLNHFVGGGGGAVEKHGDTKHSIRRDPRIKLVCVPVCSDRELVQRYAKIHQHLCDVVDSLNSCSSFQVSEYEKVMKRVPHTTR